MLQTFLPLSALPREEPLNQHGDKGALDDNANAGPTHHKRRLQQAEAAEPADY
jgi:hypothetical protein